jgi:O-antigen ligase
MDERSYGIALVTVLGLAVGLTALSRGWVTRSLGGVSVLLILHATLLTYSRGAFLGLLMIGLMAFLIMPKRPFYIAIMIALSLVTLRLSGAELAARFMSTFAEGDERDVSASSRIDLWRDCLRVVADYPMLGVGPDNWPHIAADYGWPPGKEAHSVWVQTAAEVGIPGVMALLLFYGTTMAKLWRTARSRSRELDELQVAGAAGIVIGLAGFAISAQFVSLKGLEHPFYLVMGGIALLRHSSTASAAEPVQAVPSPNAAFIHPAMRRT